MSQDAFMKMSAIATRDGMTRQAVDNNFRRWTERGYEIRTAGVGKARKIHAGDYDAARRKAARELGDDDAPEPIPYREIECDGRMYAVTVEEHRRAMVSPRAMARLRQELRELQRGGDE